MATRHNIQKDSRNGKYFARIYVGEKRKYFNLGTNAREARKKLTELERQIRRGDILADEGSPSQGVSNAPHVGEHPITSSHDTNGASLTILELADLHRHWLKANRAEGTYRLFHDTHTAFVEFVGASTKVSEITRLVMENYYAWAKENRSRSANGGNAHIRNAKSLFLWAEDLEICGCPVKKFPKITETPPETKRFSDDELQTLLNCTWPEGADFREMIIFGLHTGLRPQEIRQLKPSQVIRDGERKYSILIEQHKTARMAHEPKPRSVPLTPEAASIAIHQISLHPKADYVFLNARDEMYTRGVFRQRLRRWCKRAGIKPRPPYALRHTFGSMEAEANINQTVIGQMMGHSQLRTTSRYISNNAAHHRTAIGAIGNRIASLDEKGGDK